MLERITEDAELVRALQICSEGGRCLECNYKERKCCYADMSKDAHNAIEELISRVPKWISVKDELPTPIHPSSPDYKAYLIVADGDMYIADYTYDKYFETCYSFHVDGEYMTGVTHWMELPEMPKGE